AVADPRHLAALRRGRERHGVEIVEDDAMALAARVGTAGIGRERRRRDLAQLVHRRARAPFVRVVVLDELNRERAAALEAQWQAEVATDPYSRCFDEPAPVERRVEGRYPV